jgi:hypothetical protein
VDLRHASEPDAIEDLEAFGYTRTS